MSQDNVKNGLFSLRVGGSGSVKVQPDTAIVSLGVITENKQLKLAQDENTGKMGDVLNGVIRNGIMPEDIQTKSYTVYPQYDFLDGRQVFRAYRVEHIVEVSIRNMNLIGLIIDEAVESGANQINNVNFTISNPSAYYQQALNLAVDDAFMKATTLGRRLNVEVSRVPVQVSELGYTSEGPAPMAFRDVAAATPIQSGQVEITAKIEAVFSYRPNYTD